jgi:hypothetical protein
MTVADPTITADSLASLIGREVEDWARDCHAVSISIVRTGIIPDGRVARGYCDGVGGQHSWIVKGDPYAPDMIIDPTLWSYVPSAPPLLIVDDPKTNPWGHRPHGGYNIWKVGAPVSGTGSPVVLDTSNLSREAQGFVKVLDPLDATGWGNLFSNAVLGWPCAEIMTAMLDQHPWFGPYVEIDIHEMILRGGHR